MKETLIRLKMKVASDPQNRMFQQELERILQEMNGLLTPTLEALCAAEGMDKSAVGAKRCAEVAARFSKQTIFLRHHIAGAKSATARFAGILGLEMQKNK